MPQVIDNHKVIRLTNRLLRGQSKRKAMLEEGYSMSYANQAKNSPTMKIVENRIEDKMKKVEITDEWILGKIKDLAEHAQKTSDQLTALTLLAKNKKLLTDNIEYTKNEPLLNKSAKELQDKIQALRSKDIQSIDNKQVTSIA